MLYIKRAMPVPATQWFKDGDHPAVKPLPELLKIKYGKECGWVPLKEGGYIVGPGDYIITDDAGSSWPVPEDKFIAEYYSHNPTEQLDAEQLRIIKAIEQRPWAANRRI